MKTKITIYKLSRFENRLVVAAVAAAAAQGSCKDAICTCDRSMQRGDDSNWRLCSIKNGYCNRLFTLEKLKGCPERSKLALVMIKRLEVDSAFDSR